MRKECETMGDAQQLIDSTEVFYNDYEIADKLLSIVTKNQK